MVFAFSAAIAIVAGIAFGIAPALQFTRVSLEGVLRESGRSGSGSRHHTRTRNVLVAGQIALALILLTGAGLLLRSFDRLRSVALGVQHANVITFEVNLPAGRYALPESRARFHREFQARVAALPGVRAVGAVSRLPVTGAYHSWGTRRADAAPDTRSLSTDHRTIEGGYFDALRIPLLRGRTFNAEDTATGPMRVVVSQAAARQLFLAERSSTAPPSHHAAPAYAGASESGDEDPIGKGVVINGDPAEVIGVVRDVASTARGAIRPTVYHSHWQYAANRNWALKQVIAMDRPLPGLLADVRRELAAIDPALVLHQPRALSRRDRRRHRAGALRAAADRRIRAARARARGGGDLRRVELRGDAPAPRNGHPHGARRACAGGVVADPARWRAAGGDRRRAGTGGRLRGDARAAIAAVRRERDRSDRVRIWPRSRLRRSRSSPAGSPRAPPRASIR